MARLLPFSFSRIFRANAAEKNGNSVRRALALSTAQQYSNFLMGFGSVLVLSRLLTPKEIGVYSVSLTFILVVHTLRDLGTSDFIIQAERLDEKIAETAYTINLIIAWVLGITLFLTAPLFADFFREGGVSGVIRILSFSFFLLPIGAIANAMLIREMQFGIRYRIGLVEGVVQNGVTLLLAWRGFGYYSPAWGAVAGTATSVLGCVLWASEYRVRGLSLLHWRTVTSFGIRKTGETVVNQLGGAAPDFVIGRMIGLAGVGLFSRGYGLVRMFRQNVLGAVGTVSFSTFSRLHREGKDVGEAYLRSITLVTGIGWPFLVFSSLMAYPIIIVFFGHQWTESVPILRFMALAGAAGLPVIQFQTLLTAIGRVGLAAICTIAFQGLTVIMLIGTAFVSLNTVAVGYIPVAIFQVLLIAHIIVNFTEATVRRYIDSVWPSVVITVAGILPAFLVKYFFPPSEKSIYLPLLANALAMLSGSFAASVAIRHPLWLEIRDAIRMRVLGED